MSWKDIQEMELGFKIIMIGLSLLLISASAVFLAMAWSIITEGIC